MVMPPGATRQFFLYVLLVTVFAQDEEYDLVTTTSPLSSLVQKLMPSNETGEKIGLQFLDAVIKRGQLEMAKRAYQTQLAVLERTEPEKYARLKEMPVDEMALGAIRQQAFIGQFQPPTGNKLLDVLNRNGIPVASSIKGVEQAVKKQKDIAKKDPNEMIAEAIVDKLRKQLIPNLVASLIAGENPFEKMRQSQSRSEWPRRSEGQSFNSRGSHQEADTSGYQPYFSDTGRGRVDSPEPSNRRLLPWAPSRPIIPDEVIAEAFSFPRKPVHDSNDDIYLPQRYSPFVKFSNLQAALQSEPTGSESVERKNRISTDIRRSPMKLSPHLTEILRQSPKLAAIMNSQPDFKTDLDQQIQNSASLQWPPKSRSQLSNWNIFGTEDHRKDKTSELESSPLSEFLQKLRALPKLSTIFDTSPEQSTEPSEQSSVWPPRVIASTPAHGVNPFGDSLYTSSTTNRDPFFTGVRTDGSSSGLDDLIPNYAPTARRYPRRHTTPASSAAFVPLGRHTRLRITGTTEEGNPGVGGHFVLPSVDPAIPAFDGMLSSQDHTRQEYAGTLKLPNEWLKGDSIGASLSTKTRKVSGGVGGLDLPGFNMAHGLGHI